MDRVTEDIANSLKRFSERHSLTAVYSAVVMGLNNDNTIKVELSSGLELDDVRLKSVVKEGNKFILVPKLGSTVHIAAIDNSSEYVVISVDEITELLCEIGNVKVQFSEEKITLSKGTDSYAKIIKDIIDEIGKIVVVVGVSPNVAALMEIKNRVTQISN